MKKTLLPALLMPAALLMTAHTSAAAEVPVAAESVPNRAPLRPAPFMALSVGSIKARGWLENQLKLQADGLTGHAEEAIPELGPENGWRGGPGESWEKGPYYLRGLVSLAHVKDDAKLKRQAQQWIDSLLETQREDGQLGPVANNDWWPRMVITWTLRDYHEATKDPRVIPALLKYARYMQANLRQNPLNEWAKARAADQIDTLYWLYNRTGETFLLEVADLLQFQANKWNPFFASLDGSPGDFRITHGVNVSQAMKFPVVCHERHGETSERAVFKTGWDRLTKDHGLSIGMWSGSEPLAGRSTTQGVEMCSIVEQMLSSEIAMEALGDPWIGDSLERIAFNLLPGGTTKDFKQFQYYTLPNVPVALKNPKGTLPFADDHGDDLLVSPHSGFHCCCYNLHMGWPKYVQHSWMATRDGGLAAVAYGPNEVSVKLGDTPVSIVQETDYPFSDVIRLNVKTGKAIAFPLKLRIPAWAKAPRVAVNGKFVENVTPGEFLSISQTWKSGDAVVIEFPAELETENAFRGSATLWRGPLVFSLRIKEQLKQFTKGPSGFDEIEFSPASPWNYALDIDRAKPLVDAKLNRAKMPQNPWLPETTPITLTVPAKRLPQWGLERDGFMAGEVPHSPATSEEPLEQVTLVPFGSQTLRITAFPLLRGEAVHEPGIIASHQHDQPLASLLDNPEPRSSRGEGSPRFTFWDHLGTSEWIEWTFEKPRDLSSLSIYWFDDSGSGKCKVPASWKVQYRVGGEWKPVPNASGFTTDKDRLNSVKFDSVKAAALRVEIQLQEGHSAGILQLKAE